MILGRCAGELLQAVEHGAGLARRARPRRSAPARCKSAILGSYPAVGRRLEGFGRVFPALEVFEGQPAEELRHPRSRRPCPDTRARSDTARGGRPPRRVGGGHRASCFRGSRGRGRRPRRRARWRNAKGRDRGLRGGRPRPRRRTDYDPAAPERRSSSTRPSVPSLFSMTRTRSLGSNRRPSRRGKLPPSRSPGPVAHQRSEPVDCKRIAQFRKTSA